MKIHDPGHTYQLQMYNRNYMSGDKDQILTFMKREGKMYPGNIGHHAGTNIQEVLRALINRTTYLNNQIPDGRNIAVIIKLEECLWLLEDRAAERHKREFDYFPAGIENEPTCNICGHIGCSGECEDK